MNPIRRFVLAWYSLIGITFVAILYLSSPLAFDRGLRVYFFDIGQGDATLIRTADHRNILIDGGPDNTILYRLGPVLPWYDRTIDAVVLTHPHADHLVGLIEVLRRYTVKNIIITEAVSDSAYAQAWMAHVQKEGSRILVVSKPEVLQFGTETFFTILFPDGVKNILTEKELNNTSIVGRLTYGTTDVLFTGDYENEESLVGRDGLNAEVIKVGHHGSHNATSDAFAREVGAQYAVMSMGENNRYRHPHTEALAIWQSVGATIFRTDCNGTVTFFSDGKIFTVTPQRACE